MKTEITVNNNKIFAKKGQTILSVLNENGIRIPTLCNISSLDATGACRLCVVEVVDTGKLITACSHPVKDKMQILTHSPRVIKARKTLLELLLANHPDDCLYCDNNQHCELQALARELNIRERRFHGKKKDQYIDHSSQAIIKDTSKCILCGRCIRICDEIMNVNAIDYSGRGYSTRVDTCMSKGLNFSTCIACGQCVQSCPTGALREMSSLDQVLNALRNKNRTVYIQLSNDILHFIAEKLAIKPGQKLNNMIIGALKKSGFDKVFDSGFASDLFVEESSKELSEYIKNKKPYILTHCPSVKKYIELFYPELLENTNHLKSSWQLMAGTIKNIYCKKNNINREDVFNVAVTACTASKAEAARPEMMSNGIPDLDSVISVDEVLALIKLNGIDINKSEKKDYDFPYNMSSSSASLIKLPGGTTEAVLRSIHRKNSGVSKIKELRGIKKEKDYVENSGSKTLKIKVINEIHNAIPHLNKMLLNKYEFDILEINSCPESCISNKSHINSTGSNSTTLYCSRNIYKEDDKSPIKAAYKNPLIRGFHEENSRSEFENIFYYNKKQ